MCVSTFWANTLTTDQAGTEGLSRNVVICGLGSGTIKIWDAFDLTFLSEMKNEKETSPSTASCFLHQTLFLSP